MRSTTQRLALIGLLVIFSSTAVSGVAPPGPAADEIHTSSFEGIGYMRNFVENSGIAVPNDGLPVLLQDDFDAYYLARCRRLDCATGADREMVALTDNQDRAALSLGSDGLPILAYWDKQVNALRLDHCNNTSCFDRSTQNLATGNTLGVSVAVGTDGFPIVTYYSSGTLYFIKCNDLACDDTETEVMLDATSFAYETSTSINSEGFPTVAYANVTFLGGGNSQYITVLITCTTADCSGTIERSEVELGPLFVADISLAETLKVVVPPDSLPVLLANAVLAGGGGSRIVAIACETTICDAAADPRIIGVQNESYPNKLDADISADGLPMLSVDGLSDSGIEFIQCQTPDCSGAVTNRVLPRSLVGEGQLPKITVAADGNPIMTFFRGANTSGNTFAGVVYCRDPECESFAFY